ncbi:hypothetical protein [Ulvibacterium sp.]|uniref:hypothetical protein n=1 Tax=Ulvibacterium sp. TaxID=2665914 RepID=UPI003BAA2906
MPRYLPPLSVLISPDQLPESLSFLVGGVESIFSKLYFRDFHTSRAYYSNEILHQITLVSESKIAIGIDSANELQLVLNPSFVQGNPSEFPLTLSWYWPIKKYIENFEVAKFDFSFRSFYDLLFMISGTEEPLLLLNLINIFYEELGEVNSQDSYQAFIDDFNTKNNPTTPITRPAFDDNLLIVEDIINQLNSNGNDYNVTEVIFQDYFVSNDQFGTITFKLESLFSASLGQFSLNTLSSLFVPKSKASLDSLSLALEFPRTWLKPIDPNTLDVIEGDIKSTLTFDVGNLLFDTSTGFEFNNTSSFTLTPSQIGNTGLIIEVTNLKLDLKDDTNIPEADAYGYGPEFKGVYAQTASITLPKKWFDNNENNPNTTARLAGYDILVGTGGFSGRMALEVIDGTSDPLLVKTVGTNGFEVGFSAYNINFDRNKVVFSSIVGRLKIPKLKDELGNDAEIDIQGHLDSDGDFLLTASEQDGFTPIEIPEVLKIYIQGVELGQEDGDFFIGTTADIEFTNPIMSKLLCAENGTPTRIALPNVRIYSNGNFEIVGGGIPLPTNFGLCLGPVNMSITNLNFTSHQQEYNGVQREYKCWGFDGALNVDPLGVDVRGNGVKYCYTVDDDPANGKPGHSYIRISTIEVDLIIPGNASPDSATAIINGYVSIPEPGVSTEYSGGVSLKLPKVGISGSVEMRVDPKYPAFILDARVEIPTPIPLAATGLGVFGFRGLLGMRYVAEKEAVGLTSGVDSWYDYYVYPERGINIQKFSGPAQTIDYKNPFSLGAGAAIATYGNDSIINFRVFLLLSIPSLFFIEGKANILSKQLGLDDTDEPPFFAFLAIGDNSIEAGLGADFKLPGNSGDLLEIRAKVEAGFFFNNPSAFYVNIGTKQDPITARVVSLITAQLYLQLSAKGIEAGARAEFEFDKKYGPVRVRAYAYIEMGGFISFERPQLGGYFAVGGEALVDIKVLSIYIGLDLLLGAEAARPYLIYGEFRLCVKVRILFVKIRFCGKVSLKWEKSRVIDRTPIPPIAQEEVLELAKGVHMLTGDAFDLAQLNTNITDPNYVPSANNNKFNNTVLPLDTYIDIKFGKALDPTAVSNKTGSINNPPVGNVELIPPQKTIRGKEVRQVKHEYSIEDIEIKAWTGSTWVDYNPYEALLPDAVDSGVNTANLKLGHWQKPGKEYNALRLLGDSPFSFIQLGEPGWYIPEQLGITATSLFCEASPLEPECANWLKKDLGITYLASTDLAENDASIANQENFFTTGRLAFWVRGPIFVENLGDNYNATVAADSNTFGFARSLKIFNFMSVEIRVPNPSRVIKLKLSTTAEGATLSFYKSIINDASLTVQYQLVDEVYKTRAELAQEVNYENADQSISRVIVQPDFLNLERINVLNSRLETLGNEAYEAYAATTGGETELIGSGDASEESAIQQEIIGLIETGCAANVLGEQLTGGIGQMQIGTSFCVGMLDSVLESLDAYTSCTTLVHEVCWLSEVDYEFNLTIPAQPAIQEDFELAEQSVSKVIAPIWRPDTKYYMHLCLRDTVDNDEGGSSADYHYYYGFRTAGPIGHFHNANGVSYGLNPTTGETNRDGNGNLIAPERFPLANLTDYIDYGRSYPNADGNLLASKPLFYANQQAKLQLFFVRPQTYHMFNTWEAKNGFAEIVSEMKVIIKDPVKDILIPYPLPVDFDETTIPNTEEVWEDDTEPLVPEHVKFWNNLVGSSASCVATGGEAVRPKTKKRTIRLTNLKPQKLYTALVNNVHQGTVTEVHNYVFKTSRYANFTEQINSYQLNDGDGNTGEAIFRIPISLSAADIDTSLNIIDSIANENSPDAANLALRNRFTDRFDRVVEGLWGLTPLPVAETTEFNAVVDQNTGDTIVLWIRNPETFNDPKTLESNLETSIQILNNANDQVDGNYKILHSKDRAQVLIMRNNKKITNTALRIRFQYLLWNGTTYEIEDTVLVENLNIFGI